MWAPNLLCPFQNHARKTVRFAIQEVSYLRLCGIETVHIKYKFYKLLFGAQNNYFQKQLVNIWNLNFILTIPWKKWFCGNLGVSFRQPWLITLRQHFCYVPALCKPPTVDSQYLLLSFVKQQQFSQKEVDSLTASVSGNVRLSFTLFPCQVRGFHISPSFPPCTCCLYIPLFCQTVCTPGLHCPDANKA